MTKLKSTGYFIIILLLGLYACASRKQQPPVVVPKKPAGLMLTAQAAGMEYQGEGEWLIYVTTTLFNPTKDTIRFYTMYCSYSEYFLTDTSAYFVRFQECNKNFPDILSIPPGYKLDQLIELTPSSRCLVYI